MRRAILAVTLVSIGLAAAPGSALAETTPSSTCAESVPPGAARPTLTEKLPARATAGELVKLEVVVRHGAGETATLPADLPRLLSTGEVRVADDGTWGKGALPTTAPDLADPAFATTILEVPFVVLSTSLPRKSFTIPSVRVVVLRKGGGDLSVCTSPHEIAVDQPTASSPDPFPRPNPPSVPQRTVDERAKAMAYAAAIAALVVLALAALVLWWRSRPKPAAPPPAPEPSWKLALDAIRRARLEYVAGNLAAKAYYDRLSDAVRAHLGEAYGFDGLEQTTDEILARLRRVPSPALPFADVERFLSDCDLVKFANHSPPVEEGEAAADLAATLVRATAHGRGHLRPYDAWSTPRETSR